MSKVTTLLVLFIFTFRLLPVYEIMPMVMATVRPMSKPYKAIPFPKVMAIISLICTTHSLKGQITLLPITIG